MTRRLRWMVLIAVVGCYFDTPTHPPPDEGYDSAVVTPPEGGNEAGQDASENDPDAAPGSEAGAGGGNDSGMDASTQDEAGTWLDGALVSLPEAAGPLCMCTTPGKPACVPSTGQCVQCTASDRRACTGSTPFCDLTSATCVACNQDSECPSAARAKCDLSTHTCVPCDAKAQCAHVAGLNVCNAGSCVQCNAGDPAACTGTTKPYCASNGNTCVACNVNQNCTDPTKPTCEANACRACRTESDCTGKVSGSTALDACYNGQCVDCRVNPSDTKQDVGCTSNIACDPTTRTCTGKAKNSLGICQACVADAECVPSHRCVEMSFEDAPITPNGKPGGFCLLLVSAPGDCPRPYAATPISRASRSGAAADSFCGVNESEATCDAIRAFGTSCSTNMPCSALGSRCEIVSGGRRCTYGCASANSVECPENQTCPSGTDSYCGG